MIAMMGAKVISTTSVDITYTMLSGFHLQRKDDRSLESPECQCSSRLGMRTTACSNSDVCGGSLLNEPFL